MSPLKRKIREEIAEHGQIAFARFMELALYCPEYGFYEKEEDNVGRAGHFYTSVSVGPLFGELLAFQFARWFEETCRVRGARHTEHATRNTQHATLQLIEAGAHDGRLATDILSWLQTRRPEIFRRTEYCIVEPSIRRQSWQRKALAQFSSQLQWFTSFPAPHSAPRTPHFPICFSNELLDAMPVRRFGWDSTSHCWFEWGVAVEADLFIWTRMSEAIDPAAVNLPSSPELLQVLPDGYTIEISPAAEAWWSNAAKSVSGGRLLTFDYGFCADESISPERLSGTLRAYSNHKQVEDVLATPGEQDITAHVDFGRIKRAGEVAGLMTELLETQEKFLTRIASETWKHGVEFGEWDQKRTRQFQTLTHPQHLGRNFRVLIQSAAIGA